MKNPTIIQQLQIDASNPDVSVSSLLRQSKIIATKLDLTDFLIWVNRELNGYGETSSEIVPAYRKITGEPKVLNPYYGWQPILFKNAQERDCFSNRLIGQAIGTLEEVARKNNGASHGRLSIPYSSEIKQLLLESLESYTDVLLEVSGSAAHGILDAVRNSILDWALQLEKAGITGDGLSFSKKDKTEATHVTNLVFAQNIAHVGNLQDQAQTVNYQIASVAILNGKITTILEEIKKTIHLLPVNKQPEIKQKVEEIQKELSKPEDETDQTKISGALGSIKNICEGIAGNVVAQGIISLIGKLTS